MVLKLGENFMVTTGTRFHDKRSTVRNAPGLLYRAVSHAIDGLSSTDLDEGFQIKTKI